MIHVARHLTAPLAVAYFHAIGTHWKPTVDTIRKWAERGHVTRRGRAPSGHTIYDVDDMIRHARRRGLLDDQ